MTDAQKTIAVPIMLTITQAAELIGFNVMLLRRYIWAKKGPRVVRFGRRIRIRTADLLDWVDSQDQHPSVWKKKVKICS